MEKLLITEIIENGYIKPAYLMMETNEMRKAFHPEFVMFIPNENKIEKWSIDDFIGIIEKGKQRNSNTSVPPITYNIPYIDITENEAIAKVEIYLNGKRLFTDYISLYKLGDGWRIIGKVYYKHF
jgi:hypothetical protein